MCDYSLEAFRTRPAAEGEEYITHRFATGTVGFIAAGDPATTICMAYDTELALADIPAGVQATLGAGPAARARFSRLENSLFHDGVRFTNGKELTLQQLGPGVKATLVDALTTRRETKRETVKV